MAEEAEGQVGPEDVAPVEPPAEVADPDVSVDDEETARQVLAGQWGRGHARDAKLAAAGHDVRAVNKAMFKILGRK